MAKGIDSGNDPRRKVEREANAAFVKARREAYFGPDVPQPPYRGTNFLADVNREDLPDYLK